MVDNAAPFPKVSPVGESGLLVELGNEVNQQVNDSVLRTDFEMQASLLNGVIEWVPGYASILVHYDPLVTTYQAVHQWLQDCLDHKAEKVDISNNRIKILVNYGGEEGPDLDQVAKQHDMSPLEVVKKHTGRIYKVGMMGFTPGFAYLIGMDPDLTTPRLSTPRIHVPMGSVGIAGSQTGIYPLDSPGGWQIIGKTEQILFDPQKTPHFLFSPGDEVQFIAADAGIHG